MVLEIIEELEKIHADSLKNGDISKEDLLKILQILEILKK